MAMVRYCVNWTKFKKKVAYRTFYLFVSWLSLMLERKIGLGPLRILDFNLQRKHSTKLEMRDYKLDWNGFRAV